MEKYGTYEVYKNKLTGKLLRIPHGEELEKQAGLNSNEWKKLDNDPEVNTQ